MSIKTSELQQLSPLTGAERLLADSPGAGTGLIPFNEAAQFLGGELIKPGNAVGAALENKASADFSNLPSPQTALYNLGAGTGRNLLDNPDFGINQKQQTEYANYNEYTVDRWYSEKLSVTLGADGLTLERIDPAIAFIQYWEAERIRKIAGKILTLSLLTTAGLSFCVFQMDMDEDGNFQSTVINRSITSELDSFGPFITFGSKTRYQIARIVPKLGGRAVLVAAKLELGPVQTLAHKEGDTWVLNDPPPDPALELAKCQRYQLVFDKGVVGWFQCLYTGTGVSLIQTPVTMRVNPAITLNGKLLLQRRRSEAYLNVSASNIGSINYNSGAVSVDLVGLEGDTVGEIYNMRLATGSKLILDANL